MTRRQAPLSERVGSALENGYGDEGINAHLIAGILTLTVVVVSTVIAPVVGVVWVVKRLRGRGKAQQ